MSARTVQVVAADGARRAALVRLLTEDGYAVATAGSDQEAFDRLTRAEAPPDLVLLDRAEPGGTGWAVRKRQHYHTALSRAPLLILSVGGPAREAQAEEGVLLLHKPVRDEHLLAAVRRLTGQAAARQGSRRARRGRGAASPPAG